MNSCRKWQIHECRSLLRSWKNHVYMFRFLRKHSSKNQLYSAIYRDLQSEGYNRSLNEVLNKVKNFRRKELLSSHFRWYNEVKEIMNLEKIEIDLRLAAETQMESASKLLYEPCEEENIPESVQVVTTNVPKDGNDSDSDLLSQTPMKSAEPEEPLQLSGSNSKKSTETILMDICKEFQSSNHQLEANDIAILELFKEQNDIFRKQTKLMMKMYEKD